MNQSNQVYQLHFLQMNQLRGRNYLMHQVLLHTLLQISLYLKIFDPKMIFNFDNQILIFVVFHFYPLGILLLITVLFCRSCAVYERARRR